MKEVCDQSSFTIVWLLQGSVYLVYNFAENHSLAFVFMKQEITLIGATSISSAQFWRKKKLKPLIQFFNENGATLNAQVWLIHK